MSQFQFLFFVVALLATALPARGGDFFASNSANVTVTCTEKVVQLDERKVGLGVGNLLRQSTEIADQIGKFQRLLDPVQIGSHRNMPMQQHALDPPDCSVFGDADALLAGDDREEGRPVAGLRRDRKIVAAEQLPHERKAVAGRGPRRNRDHAVDIRIARQDRRRIGKHQHLDPRIRIGAAQASDQWRRQQHVTEAPQRHHEDARLRRQSEARSHVLTAGFGAADCEASRLRESTAPPATPTPKM